MDTHKKYLKLGLSEKKEKKKPNKRDILDLLDKANKELEKYYDGKYGFSVVDEEDYVLPEELKLSPKKKRKIKEIWLQFDSELSSIQRRYEKFLQKSLEHTTCLHKENDELE